MATKNTMSVHLDDEITLTLLGIREEMKRSNAASGLPLTAPSIGWLARSLLRERLGLVGSVSAKQDIPDSV